MPKGWKNPRHQRLVFQLVMILILGGTVGLAAAIVQAHRSPMGATVVKGDYSYRFPAGWKTFTPSNIRGMRAIAGAEEPGGRHRKIGIYTQNFPIPLTSQQFLASLRLSPETIYEPLPILVRGYRGIILPCEDSRNGQTMEIVLSCFVIPPGQVFLVQITGDGSYTSQDRSLIYQVTDSIRNTAAIPAPIQVPEEDDENP